MPIEVKKFNLVINDLIIIHDIEVQITTLITKVRIEGLYPKEPQIVIIPKPLSPNSKPPLLKVPESLNIDHDC